MRTLVAVCSDFQSGSAYGLADPKTLLEREDKDGNPFYLPVPTNPITQYLYEIYEWGMQETFKLAGKDKIHLIVNGDMTQGNHFRDDDLLTGRESDQTKIAADLIAPWCKRVKTVRLTKSTAVHAFNGHSGDTGVAERLRLMFPKLDTRLVGHGLSDIDGVLHDFAHHGPPGGKRSWLKGNLMRYEVRSIQDTCIKDGRPVPHAIWRAHKHERVEEWVVDWRMDERVKTVGITTPSFQMLTEHARKVTESTPKVTNGMVVCEQEDGRIIDLHWFAKTRYLPAQETL